MKLGVLFKMNMRFLICLWVAITFIISPVLVFYETSNSIFAFIGIFYVSILLMSYWVWVDGRKIENLERLLNSQKAENKKELA